MDGGWAYEERCLRGVFECCASHYPRVVSPIARGYLAYFFTMSRDSELERKWTIVGWIFAGIALVIVAGPQILALITQ